MTRSTSFQSARGECAGVGTDIPLEGLHAGTPIKVVTDMQGGQEWVAAIELDR